ncbi:hypothetical protein CFB46_04190 [Burkholderia sp. HI2761]|uniref:hypothetical protein n=1 Tax=unclassified Burkholderia TaxID=2613784 RepID=UPI000B7A6C6B|nr:MULTISPECIES: hypothetical protein [unclassified Burkholderia]MPV60921.1 hypothetical protein [Burkholderia sp. BE24]OXJ28778.1 hypothetical protein CFB46_04190 [Burkholderia sp. HI2761]
MSTLNCGTIDRCSVTLNTATLLGLKAAYEDFATTEQDLRNFEICITDKRASTVAPGPDDDVITVMFVAKLIPGMRTLGNANRLGKSIHYVIAPETGEILGIFGTK